MLISLVVSSAIFDIREVSAATYGAPSAPQSITQSASAAGVALTWSAPAFGSPTSYVIEKSTNGTAWSSVTTISSASTSYTISSELNPSTVYYFRIAAVSSATRGANGYPWTKIYGTTTALRSAGNIVYEAGYGITAGNAFSGASEDFSRIRYRMGTTINSVSKYADVDFNKWSTDKTSASVLPSIAELRIPTTAGTANQFVVQANVTDLNIYSDNSAVNSGFGMDGRLEIWPWNYSASNSALSPNGNGGTYDYDDSPAGASNYGSFQVHDMSNFKPVFVWNRHTDGPEIAYGKSPGGNPDWTFCKTATGTSACPVPSSFSLQIYVNLPITTSSVTTPTFSSWSNVTKTFGDSTYTVTPPTVTASIAGDFSYSSSNSSVISISGSTFTVAGAGAATITATFTPTDSASYNSATTTNDVSVEKASQTALSITTTSGSFGSPLTLATSGGSSGEAVTYQYAAGTTICTLTSGNILTPEASGTCLLTATMAGNTNYNAISSLQTTITFTTTSVSATITLEPGALTYRQAKSVTASSSVAGKVTFKVNGKVIPRCKKKVVLASATVTCSYRPSTRGYVVITATLNPTDPSYIGTTTTTSRYFVYNRSGQRGG